MTNSQNARVYAPFSWGTNRFSGGLGKIGQIGESTRFWAEELNAKAKGTAKQIEEGSMSSLNNVLNTTMQKSNDGDAEGTKTGAGNGNGDAPEKEGALSTRDSESVSKEELMDILEKMSKRIKALSSLRATLMERVKSAENDKNRLLQLMRSEVVNEIDLEEALMKAASKNAETLSKATEAEIDPSEVEKLKIDEISVIQLAWQATHERNQLALQQIQNEYKVISMQVQAEVEKVRKATEAEKQIEIQKAKAEALEVVKGTYSNNAAGTANKDVPKEVIDKAVKEAVAACKKRHDYELEQLRKGFEESHQLTVQALRDEALQAQKMMLKELEEKAADDLETVMVEADKRVNEALWKAKSAQSDNENKRLISMKKEFEAQLAESQAKHDDELKSAIQQISDMSNRMEETEKSHVEQIKAITIDYMETLNKMKEKAEKEKMESIGVLKVKVKSKMEEMKQAFNVKIKRTIDEETARHEKKLEDFKEKYELQIKELKEQNEKNRRIASPDHI